MNNIFTYTDYRKLLADYYEERKSLNPSYSYQVFASKAGIPNRGFLYNVISGKKNLSRESALKVSQAMNLKSSEADFFEVLVFFNQAKTLKERNHYFEKLNEFKSHAPQATVIRELHKEHYEFYSKWYISAIRSLIDMFKFKDDYSWLAKTVFPPIKPLEAKKAVLLLEKLGMITQGADGFWIVKDKTITAGPEITGLGLLNFQVQSGELAINAMKEMTKDKRHISGMTMGLSRKSYELICNEIITFQSKLQSIAENDNEADNVYQFNFQLFPISNANGIVTGRQGWHGKRQ
ncbi:MAG: TIGR02147 family protein [Fibrobacter sp.]|nr:TIGR02147 family protein [Fibrobacter sp.]